MSATATARVTRPIATRRTAQASGSTSTQGRAEAGAVNRPQLRVVSGASRAASSSLPFLTVIILVLAGALISSMLLNAKMADTAYRMKEKQIELNVAEDHVETLRTHTGLSAKAARARAPVLIEGENGVGKDVIAEAIHAASPRSRRTRRRPRCSCCSSSSRTTSSPARRPISAP